MGKLAMIFVSQQNKLLHLLCLRTLALCLGGNKILSFGLKLTLKNYYSPLMSAFRPPPKYSMNGNGRNQAP